MKRQKSHSTLKSMSKINIDFTTVGAQADFLEDLQSKFLHFSGGFGSGKSTTLVHKALQLSYLNRPFPGGFVCPSFTDYKKDILPILEDVLHDNRIKFDYHGSDYKFRFPWSRGWMYVVSAEKKLRGPNWGWACVNELTLIPLMRYREVIGRVRLRGCSYPQVASCGTPEGIGSEYHEVFVEKPMKGSKCLYMDTRENAHNLAEGYIDNLFASYPRQLIDAYMKGLWVNLSGNTFYFSYDPLRNHDRTLVPDEDLPFEVFMDFNVDPFCASVWQVRAGILCGVDEIELKGGEGYKTENMIAALKARGYTPFNTRIYPDPAGKSRSTKGDSDVQILEDAGYEVRVRSVAPRYRERQVNVNNLLDKRKIIFNPDTMPGVKRDFEAVELDPVIMEKRKNNPRLTHFSDGVDYGTDILYPFKGHSGGITSARIR